VGCVVQVSSKQIVSYLLIKFSLYRVLLFADTFFTPFVCHLLCRAFIHKTRRPVLTNDFNQYNYQEPMVRTFATNEAVAPADEKTMIQTEIDM
jgi:hypothetical protein